MHSASLRALPARLRSTCLSTVAAALLAPLGPVALAIGLGASGATGCDDAPPPPSPPTVTRSNVEGDATIPPTATLGVSFSAPPDGPSVNADSILVVEGLADDALLADADQPPLDEAHRLELVPGKVGLDGAVARFVPSRPLAAAAIHTLVVTRNVTAGGLRLAQRYVRTFVTGAASTGAPVLTLTAPAAGAIDVVRNRRAVAVAFTRPVRGVSPATLTLATEGDPPVPARVVEDGCDRCWRIEPEAPLAAARTYRVIADPAIVDDDGEPVFPADPPELTTGDTLRTGPPTLLALDALPSSGCLVVRWQLDRPADGALMVDGLFAEDAVLAPRHELALPLAPGLRAPWRVWSRDESTAPPADSGILRAPPSSSRPLVLTEALTRPKVGGAGQQFVEVRNVGMATVSLGGLVLVTDSGEEPLPAVPVGAGAFALIVPSGWVPDDGQDPVPAPGTAIAAIGHARLGRYGLHVGGESLVLAEEGGLPVSRFSTEGLSLAHGQSARRAAPCDVAASIVPTPNDTSTPGAP